MKNDQPPFYTIKGKKYDRVTAALRIARDPAYDQFRERFTPEQREEMMDNAAVRGKEFHRLTNLIEKGTIDNLNHPIIQVLHVKDPVMCKMVSRYFTWFEETVEKVICIEKKVWNSHEMYAGTPDGIFVLKGSKSPVMIEKKSTAIKSLSYELQKIAYLNTDQMYEQDVKKCVSIIIDKKGSFHKPIWTDRDPALYVGFLQVLSVYRLFQNRGAM